jgi:Fe-S oxidoreductase
MVKFKLAEYMEWLERCNKCTACTEYMEDYSFEPLCPMAERFVKESYRPSGLMELARLLAVKSIELKGKPEAIDILELCKLVGFNPKSLSARFFACTECGACDASCFYYSGKHPLEIFKEVRRELAQKGFIPERFNEIRENVLNFSSPFIIEKSRAAKMGKFFRIPETAEIPEKGKLLYFIGCTTAYSLPQVARATMSVLKKAGVDFAVMHNEICCGYPMIHTGQQDATLDLVKSNIQRIEKTGAKTVLTSCAGCYQVLSRDYPKLVDKITFEVVHTTRFFDTLINKGLEFKPIEAIVTYHDPCNIGRMAENPMYDEPRNILSNIPKMELLEMRRNKRGGFCCGSGGGVAWSYPFKMEDWISQNRASEAAQTLASVGGKHPSYLVSACPACELAFKNASKQIEGLKVLDISEVMAKAVNGSGSST